MILDKLLHRVIPVLICLGLFIALRFGELGAQTHSSQGAAIALGVLLIGAFVGGQVAASFGLPRITGYLLVGLIFGPHVTKLLTQEMLVASKAVNGIAVALIALTAGGETKLAWVKAQMMRLTTITLFGVLVVALAVSTVVFLGRNFLPIIPSGDTLTAIVIAIVCGAIAVASSPSVTIAVIAETKSDGPVSRTVLGVTILKDLCVIVLFAVALAIAKKVLGEGSDASLGATLTRELGGSVVAGILFGVGIAWFLKHVDRDVPVFVLAISFCISELSAALHLESLLVALTAGFYVENYTQGRGHKLIVGIERVALPVYALFFGMAGTKVNLGALASLWPAALLLIGVRALGVYWGTRVGARVCRAEPEVVRYAWLGFISQAGVTLALSAIVARAFPTWGAELQVLIIAMIAVHELLGPIGFQYALRKAGEIGKAAHAEAEIEVEATPVPPVAKPAAT